MITNRPQRLETAGVPAEEVQQSLRDIVDQVEDRGPGGHILTGPIYIEGAQPGDVLEVRVLSINLAIPYAYNGCSGFLPDNCTEPARASFASTESAWSAISRRVSRSRYTPSSAAWAWRRQPSRAE